MSYVTRPPQTSHTPGEKLLCRSGSPARGSVMTSGAGCGEGREAPEGDDMRIIVADLRCCMAETNTTLGSSFPSVKNKF